MSKKVKLRHLEKVLRQYGFAERTRGNHYLFRHPETGLVLTVPTHEETVRPIYVATIARQLANTGIATTASFNSRLEKMD